MFWSLWLIPFGWLVLRSGFLPKLLGVGLWCGAVGEMINVVTFLFPGTYANVLDPIGQILAVGELPIIPGLIIWGSMRDSGAVPDRPATASAQ